MTLASRFGKTFRSGSTSATTAGMPVRDPRPARHIEWPDMVYSKNEDLRILHDMKEESEKKRKRKRESSPHFEQFDDDSSEYDCTLFPEGTVTVNTISSVNASFNKKAYLRPVDQGILKDKEGMLNDEVVNWALQVWMNELVGKELNDIYICHAGFWPSIHSDVLKHDKKLVAGDIFRRKVVLIPVYLPGHWIAMAIINPCSVWEPMENLNTTSYPIIVVADSVNPSAFEYPQFRHVRLWMYDLATNSTANPQRDYETLPKLARMKAPIQTNSHECGYHMLHNLRQIHENYKDILDMVHWDSSMDILPMDTLSEEEFNKLWRPDVFPFRKIALQKTLESMQDIRRARKCPRADVSALD